MAEYTPAQLRDLRESVRLEEVADLYAAACNFTDAVVQMKAANAIRSRILGKGLDPNELRERTTAAVASDIRAELDRVE
jgi:hypothetical protein